MTLLDQYRNTIKQGIKKMPIDTPFGIKDLFPPAIWDSDLKPGEWHTIGELFAYEVAHHRAAFPDVYRIRKVANVPLNVDNNIAAIESVNVSDFLEPARYVKTCQKLSLEDKVRKILNDKYNIPSPVYMNKPKPTEFPANINRHEPECNEDKKKPYRDIFVTYRDEYINSGGDETVIDDIAERMAKDMAAKRGIISAPYIWEELHKSLGEWQCSE